jgi:hypothetical protein
MLELINKGGVLTENGNDKVFLPLIKVTANCTHIKENGFRQE